MGAWRSMCAVAALTLMPGMANAAMEQATPHRCRRPGEVGTATFAETEAANIGPAWIGGLAEYWREHKYYPLAAARAGEGGSVQVMADVNRLGRVQSVRVVCSSGSSQLDVAALATWRNAQLRPLPAENGDSVVSIQLTLSYIHGP